MRLANPIYDVVFKHLIEDREIASALVSRLIGAPVLELMPLPQETQRLASMVASEEHMVQIFRMDFTAELELANGQRKRVLIELQKAHEPDAVARFRNYLSKHYAVAPRAASGGTLPEMLPIIAIYLLGFRLSNQLPKVVQVVRSYHDPTSGGTLRGVSDPFIEALTHDAVIVQIPDIDESVETELDRALVLFNQGRIVGGDPHYLEVSEATLRASDPLTQHMARRLLSAAADQKTMEQMALEDEWTGVMTALDRAVAAEPISQ